MPTEAFLQLLDLLDERNLEYVVHGGWAVEALTGVERPHGDIDLAARIDQRERFLETLKDYIREIPSPTKLKLALGATEAEVVFYNVTPSGDALIRQRRYRYVLPPYTRMILAGEIRGRKVKVASPASIAIVIHVRSHPKPIPAKNQHDLRELTKLMTDEEKALVPVYKARSLSRLWYWKWRLGF